MHLVNKSPRTCSYPGFTIKRLFILRRITFFLLICIIIIGTATAMPVPYRMNISSQPPSVEPGGACIITVYAMGEYMVPLEGVDITLMSRIPGVTLSPDSGKTDESGRFESVMSANSVENPMITIAGAATTSKVFYDAVTIDIPLQIPSWENEKPVASLSAEPVRGGNSPLQVAFSAVNSSDPDGMVISYDWDFGDGETGSGARIVHAYPHSGVYNATVTVMNHRGAHSAPASVTVQVPEKTLLHSLAGNPIILILLAGIGIAAGVAVLLLTRRSRA
ncbi:PKD domain-containing protein [uncultured Methanoregula sp.]|uniref:PKD domain-containing protein n=1 Tax=uncultured Methanoregula sp. TaxID=1005933 RepID=UPI002AABE0E1|nr:PKD domain-containing protein [uncultured Methanoregula sp.]